MAMATHGDYSPEARERAYRTVLVADVFADNAEVIVAALPNLPEGSVLVAVVDADHAFGGTHPVERHELVERVPELEGEGGWAMVFSPGVSVQRRAKAHRRNGINRLATGGGDRADRGPPRDLGE